MKRGRKPDLPSTKKARGTSQPCRDAGRVEVIEHDAVPRQPEWLTPEGQMIWLEDIGRVIHHGLVGELDSTVFGNYCNLQGAIAKAWRLGEVPPSAAISEARKMAEQFGIFGRKSRMRMMKDGGASQNPFAKNGRK